MFVDSCNDDYVKYDYDERQNMDISLVNVAYHQLSLKTRLRTGKHLTLTFCAHVAGEPHQHSRLATTAPRAQTLPKN